MTETLVTAAATFCATLADEWVRSGLTDAFIAPGSRSTPLALALGARSEIAVHVFHDERSASFAALGHGLATGRPAVVLCSSGTAGAHFAAAVIEADLSAVPLVVCTADRPPGLWDVGAPQVIDQTKLFGNAVRFFGEPGVPAVDGSGWWRSLASRSWVEAVGWSGRPGPVHLNLSFDDPLVGRPDDLPEGRAGSQPWHQLRPLQRPTSVDIGVMAERFVGRRGVVIAGRGVSDPSAVIEVANRLGWPVLADHRSGCRRPDVAIDHFDSLLRSPAFAEARQPQVILRFGQTLASKALSQWTSASAAGGCEVIVGHPSATWIDPERVASTVVAEPGLAIALLERIPADMVASDEAAIWQAADRAAAVAVGEVLSDAEQLGRLTEPAIARTVLAAAPRSSALVAASSMPVREIEWFGKARADLAVYANRGANGIDGTVATAIGVALTGVPTTVLIGDVALLHDSTSLIALAPRRVDLTIVVVDNDGGGIFSFLPQGELLTETEFEQLFGTPHGTDLAALAAAHGIEVAPWGADLRPSGVRLVVATPTLTRSENVAFHERLHTVVAEAVAATR